MAKIQLMKIGPNMPKAKVAVAQITTLTAYHWDLSIGGDSPLRLSLNRYPELYGSADIDGDYEVIRKVLRLDRYRAIAEAIRNCANEYNAVLREEVWAIIRKAADLDISLSVFPEYSIPGDLIEDIHGKARKTGVSVVAGSHTVTRNDIDTHPYRTAIRDRLQDDSWDMIAVAPVLLADNSEPIFVFKQVSSKFEPQLYVGLSDPDRDVISVPLRNTSEHFSLALAICAEFVRDPGSWVAAEQIKRSWEHADVIAIVSLTPSTKPFHDDALRFMRERRGRIAIAFCNTALRGDSAIMVNDDRTETIRTLPAHNEGILWREIPVGSGAGERRPLPVPAVNICRIVVKSKAQQQIFLAAEKLNNRDFYGASAEIESMTERLSQPLKYIKSQIAERLQYSLEGNINKRLFAVSRG